MIYLPNLVIFFRYPSLRVAYVDEREETADAKSPKVFYSVLLKGGDKFDEVQGFPEQPYNFASPFSF